MQLLEKGHHLDADGQNRKTVDNFTKVTEYSVTV